MECLETWHECLLISNRHGWGCCVLDGLGFVNEWVMYLEL